MYHSKVGVVVRAQGATFRTTFNQVALSDLFADTTLRPDVREDVLRHLYAAGLKKEDFSCYLVGDLVTATYKPFSPLQLIVCLDKQSADQFNETIGKYLTGLAIPAVGRRAEYAFQNGIINLGIYPAVYDVKHAVWFKGEPEKGSDVDRSFTDTLSSTVKPREIEAQAGYVPKIQDVSAPAKSKAQTQQVEVPIPAETTAKEFYETFKAYYPYGFQAKLQTSTNGQQMIVFTIYPQNLQAFHETVRNYWNLVGKEKKPITRTWEGVDTVESQIALPKGAKFRELQEFLEQNGPPSILTLVGPGSVKLESYNRDADRLKELVTQFLGKAETAQPAAAVEPQAVPGTVEPPKPVEPVTMTVDMRGIEPVAFDQYMKHYRSQVKTTKNDWDYTLTFRDMKGRGTMEDVLRRQFPSIRIAAKHTFQQPENFDKIQEVGPYDLWAGANDWENCGFTWAALYERDAYPSTVHRIKPVSWLKVDHSDCPCKGNQHNELSYKLIGDKKLSQSKHDQVVDWAKSQVGKRTASAFIADVRFGDLPKDTQKDILQFQKCKADTLIPSYGMVVPELIPKADPHNLDSARDHVKGTSKKDLEKEIYEKAETKYLLLTNDRLIDGHHYLAKAEKAGVTRTLRVLDLTPLRFHKRKADHHHERTTCKKCGGVSTCRCSAPKVDVAVDECWNCKRKREGQRQVTQNGWLDPSGRFYPVESDYAAHGVFVAEHPELFGTLPGFDKLDLTNRFDEAMIPLCELAFKKKWLRVVAPDSSGTLYIEGPSISSAQKRFLEDEWFRYNKQINIIQDNWISSVSAKNKCIFRAEERIALSNRSAQVLHEDSWMSPSGQISRARFGHIQWAITNVATQFKESWETIKKLKAWNKADVLITQVYDFMAKAGWARLVVTSEGFVVDTARMEPSRTQVAALERIGIEHEWIIRTDKNRVIYQPPDRVALSNRKASSARFPEMFWMDRSGNVVSAVDKGHEQTAAEILGWDQRKADELTVDGAEPLYELLYKQGYLRGTSNMLNGIEVSPGQRKTVKRVAEDNGLVIMFYPEGSTRGVVIGDMRQAIGGMEFWLSPTGVLQNCSAEGHASFAEKALKLKRPDLSNDPKDDNFWDPYYRSLYDQMYVKGWRRVVRATSSLLLVDLRNGSMLNREQTATLERIGIADDMRIRTDTGKTIYEPPQRNADLHEDVFTALGEASMCWDKPEDAGVFQSERAEEVGNRLIKKLQLSNRSAQKTGGLREAKFMREFPSAFFGLAPDGIHLLFVSRSPVTGKARINAFLYPQYDLSQFEDSSLSAEEWLAEHPPQYSQLFHIDSAPGHETRTRQEVLDNPADFEAKLESLRGALQFAVEVPVQEAERGLQEVLTTVKAHSPQYV